MIQLLFESPSKQTHFVKAKDMTEANQQIEWLTQHGWRLLATIDLTTSSNNFGNHSTPTKEERTDDN